MQWARHLSEINGPGLYYSVVILGKTFQEQLDDLRLDRLWEVKTLCIPAAQCTT